MDNENEILERGGFIQLTDKQLFQVLIAKINFLYKAHNIQSLTLQGNDYEIAKKFFGNGTDDPFDVPVFKTNTDGMKTYSSCTILKQK